MLLSTFNVDYRCAGERYSDRQRLLCHTLLAANVRNFLPKRDVKGPNCVGARFTHVVSYDLWREKSEEIVNQECAELLVITVCYSVVINSRFFKGTV